MLLSGGNSRSGKGLAEGAALLALAP